MIAVAFIAALVIPQEPTTRQMSIAYTNYTMRYDDPACSAALDASVNVVNTSDTSATNYRHAATGWRTCRDHMQANHANRNAIVFTQKMLRDICDSMRNLDYDLPRSCR